MIVLLWTDIVILGLLLLGLGYAWHVNRHPALRATWRRVFASPAAMGASVVLAARSGSRSTTGRAGRGCRATGCLAMD